MSRLAKAVKWGYETFTKRKVTKRLDLDLNLVSFAAHRMFYKNANNFRNFKLGQQSLWALVRPRRTEMASTGRCRLNSTHTVLPGHWRAKYDRFQCPQHDHTGGSLDDRQGSMR